MGDSEADLALLNGVGGLLPFHHVVRLCLVINRSSHAARAVPEDP